LQAEKKVGKSVIGSQMSKILAEIEDDSESVKVNGIFFYNSAEVMIVKPNKALGQRAKYEETSV
jgi:hypothetical protein